MSLIYGPSKILTLLYMTTAFLKLISQCLLDVIHYANSFLQQKNLFLHIFFQFPLLGQTLKLIPLVMGLF